MIYVYGPDHGRVGEGSFNKIRSTSSTLIKFLISIELTS